MTSIEYYSIFPWYNIEERLAKNTKPRMTNMSEHLKPLQTFNYYIGEYQGYMALNLPPLSPPNMEITLNTLWNISHDIQSTKILSPGDTIHAHLKIIPYCPDVMIEYCREVCKNRLKERGRGGRMDRGSLTRSNSV